MSARYSLLVIVLVALVLMINTLWLYDQGAPACADCVGIESEVGVSE